MQDKDIIEPPSEDWLAVLIKKIEKLVIAIAFLTSLLSLVYVWALPHSDIVRIGLIVCFFVGADMLAIGAICKATHNVRNRIGIASAIFFAVFGVTVFLVSALMIASIIQSR
jgi:hypothetical protein